jgi:hypothetical protein
VQEGSFASNPEDAEGRMPGSMIVTIFNMIGIAFSVNCDEVLQVDTLRRDPTDNRFGEYPRCNTFLKSP